MTHKLSQFMYIFTLFDMHVLYMYIHFTQVMVNPKHRKHSSVSTQSSCTRAFRLSFGVCFYKCGWNADLKQFLASKLCDYFKVPRVVRNHALRAARHSRITLACTMPYISIAWSGSAQCSQRCEHNAALRSAGTSTARSQSL